MLVATFLRLLRAPLDSLRYAIHAASFEFVHGVRFGSNDSNFPIFEEHDFFGVREDRRSVGSDEMFFLSNSEYDRRAHARGDEFLGLSFVLDSHAVRATYLFESSDRRFFKILFFF